MTLVWTGRGRAVPRIVPRKGSVVHREIVEKVPMGWGTGGSQVPFGAGQMDVFTRKQDEEIVIGDSIFVRIIGIRGDKVRIGVQSPKDVHVHTKEVYDLLHRPPGQDEAQ